MIKNFDEYKLERYAELELNFLNKSREFFGENFNKIRKIFLEQMQIALQKAVEFQKIENKSCAYVSISFLNTSVIENNPTFQIDFYEEDWVYGESWLRTRFKSDFFLKYWDNFISDAQDENFYIRSQVSKVEIKSLFWGTLDKLLYIFSSYAKYFGHLIKGLNEFDDLQKSEEFFVTCGTYLDWQERICAVLPEIDLFNLEKNQNTTFRTFKKKLFREKNLSSLDLRNCYFEECIFDKFIFDDVNLCDAQFLRCRFFSVKFSNSKFAGADFFEGYFKECSFENCTSEPADISEDEYFANFRIYHCYLLNINFSENNFSQLKKINCFEKN